MNANSILSIVIPTYNRADFLDYCLSVHIPLVKKHCIQIFVSDNASTDSTKEIVKKWQLEYPLLHYHKNETNVGEINFEIALKLPKTDYIWLLGDTYQIPSHGIQYLLKTISKQENKHDAFIFNLSNKITQTPSQNYQDQNALLHDIGAIMTCLSCLVYSKILVEKAFFSRYYNTYFLQTGIIFESISNQFFNILWISNLSVTNLEHPFLQKKNWGKSSQTFEIGCEKWTNFIFSLPPSYTLRSKMKCIMDFGKVSGLFSLKSLLLLRLHDVLTFQTFQKYKYLFPLTIGYPSIMIFCLILIPKFLLQYIAVTHILVFEKNKIKKIKLLFRT